MYFCLFFLSVVLYRLTGYERKWSRQNGREAWIDAEWRFFLCIIGCDCDMLNILSHFNSMRKWCEYCLNFNQLNNFIFPLFSSIIDFWLRGDDEWRQILRRDEWVIVLLWWWVMIHIWWTRVCTKIHKNSTQLNSTHSIHIRYITSFDIHIDSRRHITLMCCTLD